MNILLDLLGALVVASLLLLMIISFQFQLTDIANRTIFTAMMISEEVDACRQMNKVLALAGINMPPDSTFVTATATRIVYRTYWDYINNSISGSKHSVELKLSTANTSVGYAYIIKQDGVTVRDLGYILWLQDLQFGFYNKTDQAIALPVTTTTIKSIRSVDVKMTFEHESPTVGAIPLRLKMQIKCYLMNCYLKGA